MTNTFDWVKISFLYKVLLSFGFSPAFVNLIKACIDKPWIAPLLNGQPASYFQASRGVTRMPAISLSVHNNGRHLEQETGSRKK